MHRFAFMAGSRAGRTGRQYYLRARDASVKNGSDASATAFLPPFAPVRSLIRTQSPRYRRNPHAFGTRMAAPLRIDFVSDVACPWCAVGLAGLRQALAALDGEVQAEIHLQPFELNPNLSGEGEDAGEHIMRKYRIDETQMDANRARIRERAAELGFAYNVRRGSRVWNTFDAHRLLHWAQLQDNARALELKQALLRAYFSDGKNVSDREVLVRIAGDVGLDAHETRRVLDSGKYADEVRAQELRFQQAGIYSVPATIVNDTYLIPGGQPPEVFERALREIATEAAKI